MGYTLLQRVHRMSKVEKEEMRFVGGDVKLKCVQLFGQWLNLST